MASYAMWGVPGLRDGPWLLDGVQQARALRGGVLRVAAGRVWLTRAGEPDDHVLRAGESIRLAPGQTVLAQPWADGERASLCWRADQLRPRVMRGRVPAAWALRGLALAFAAAGPRLADWARTAEASASRAQGCIAPGESIASSGALQ